MDGHGYGREKAHAANTGLPKVAVSTPQTHLW